VDLATTMTAALAAGTLALPALKAAAAGVSRVARPTRIGGIVILCTALAGVATASAAVAPAPARTPSTAESPPPAPGEDSYVVAPGDSLWAIACRLLEEHGPPPTAAQIDGLWRATYAANRRVIGDDPDLIFPGTALILPEDSHE
jgi:nucleoid-associated protein YgaU